MRLYGCKECNGVGYHDRIALFEILVMNENLRELITQDASTIKIKEEAMKSSYKPLIVDGINKVLDGYTNMDELNTKLRIY
ncbi:MAG: hypothetical protein HFJ54_03960 [Clostridia bacterium]|nr:hypothetical protein [Clostridia bacterium]